MVKIHHFSPQDDRGAMLAAIRRDGAIVIDKLVAPEFVARLRAETDPYMEATQNGFDDFTGSLTTRTGGLVSRSEHCCELIQNPVVLALCDGFLLDNCERYQLHLTQIIRIRPGQGAQALHRDKWAWGTHLSHMEPQLNTIWALSDFTAENGATRVAPGSGNWPNDRIAEEADLTQAAMSAGSVLVYTGSVFHSGGENRSTMDRIGLNITYTLGWLRQEENQYLSTPPALASRLPEKLQDLIGYAMGQYALGYYTPPGAPGESPETVPPQYALGRHANGYTFGNQGDLEALSDAIGRNEPSGVKS